MFIRRHVTIAPAAGDYAHTRTVEVLGSLDGTAVRLVETEADTEERLAFLVDYQRGRYGSFFNGANWAVEEWRAEAERLEAIGAFEPAK